MHVRSAYTYGEQGMHDVHRGRDRYAFVLERPHRPDSDQEAQYSHQ